MTCHLECSLHLESHVYPLVIKDQFFVFHGHFYPAYQCAVFWEPGRSPNTEVMFPQWNSLFPALPRWTHRSPPEPCTGHPFGARLLRLVSAPQCRSDHGILTFQPDPHTLFAVVHCIYLMAKSPAGPRKSLKETFLLHGCSQTGWWHSTDWVQSG